MTLTETFTLTNITYKTDAETLTVLRSIIDAAHATGDNSAVAAIMFFGLKTGRIQEVK